MCSQGERDGVVKDKMVETWIGVLCGGKDTCGIFRQRFSIMGLTLI